MKRIFWMLSMLLLLVGCGKEAPVPVLTALEAEQAYAAQLETEPSAQEADPLILDQAGGWVLRTDEREELLLLDTPAGASWETGLYCSGSDRLCPAGESLYLLSARALYAVTDRGAAAVGQRVQFLDAALVEGRLLALGYEPETPVRLYEVEGDGIRCLYELEVEGNPRFFSGTHLLTDRAIYALDGSTLTKLSDLVSLGLDAGIATDLKTVDGVPWVVTDQGHYCIVPYTAPAEKQVVQVYALDDWSSIFSSLFARFNAQSDRIVVEVKNFDSEELLSVELLAGSLPDLLVCRSDPEYLYLAREQGFLTPMNQVVDPIVSPETYFTNVVDLGRVDGNLYYFPLNYELLLYAFPEALLQGATKLETLEELDTVLRRAGQEDYERAFCSGAFTQEIALIHVTCDSLYRWMDYETRTASFDDPSFGALLTYAKRFNGPDATEKDASNLYHLAWINDLSYFAGLDEFHEEVYDFGTDFRYIPSLLSPYDGGTVWGDCYISRIAKDEPSAAADEVLQYLLSQEAQELLVENMQTHHLPLLRSALADAPDTDEADRQALISLIEQADHFRASDSTALDIVLEEAKAFFDGCRSLEDTQALIQDRVSLYLSELK